jgi:hypothetical protein
VRSVLAADVIAVSQESVTLLDTVIRHDGEQPDGQITYLLGPILLHGQAVFASATDGSRWVAPDDVAPLVVRTHRLAARDLWTLRWAQMMDDLGLAWDEPDGSTLVAHTAYLPDDRMLHFIDQQTFLEINGQRSGFAVGYRYGVSVAGPNGDTLHAHSNLTGGCALAMAALYAARYGKPEAVSDRRLEEV